MTTVTSNNDTDAWMTRLFIAVCSGLGHAVRWAVWVLPLLTLTVVALLVIGQIGRDGFLGMAASIGILALLIFLWSKTWRWQVNRLRADRFRARLHRVLIRVDEEPRWIRAEVTGPGAYRVRIRAARGHGVERLRAVMPIVADDLAWVSWVEEPGDVHSGVADFSIATTDPFAAPVTAPTISSGHSIAGPVDVAVGTSGQLLSVPLLHQHVLVGGTAGGGKSQLLLRLIESAFAADDAQTWLVDPARVEFSRVADRADRVALDPEAAAELLDELVSEMHHRLEVMEAQGITKWKVSPSAPAIVLFVDELASLTTDIPLKAERDRLTKALTTLARVARKTAITLVLATQTPDVSVVPSQLRNNMQIRVCFRVMSGEQGKTILGEYATGLDWTALHPNRPGMAFIAGGSHIRPALGRAFLVHEDQDDNNNNEE